MELPLARWESRPREVGLATVPSGGRYSLGQNWVAHLCASSGCSGATLLQPVAPWRMAQNPSLSDSSFGLCCCWGELDMLV